MKPPHSSSSSIGELSAILALAIAACHAFAELARFVARARARRARDKRSA